MQCYSAFFQKQTTTSPVVSVKVLGASKRDAETGTVVPILQDMTETKPNKILLPPFYSLYKLKEFKWKQGLVIKLIKGYLITKTTRNYLFF